MIKIIILISIMLQTGCASLPEDRGISGNVKSDIESKEFSDSIDTEKHIFGIPFGTSEKVVMNDYGKPYGYIRFNKHDTAMIYTSSSALLFTDRKLSGVRITHGIIDYELAKKLPGKNFLLLPWKLSNGLKAEMTLTEVKKIMGDKLTNNNYQWSYQTESATVTLGFSRRQGEKSDDAYSLMSITLEKK